MSEILSVKSLRITVRGNSKTKCMGDLRSPDTTDVGLNQIYNNGN
ncbi:MAG: hypothetical protein R3A12_14685 [Ignavibacteria bacterium]